MTKKVRDVDAEVVGEIRTNDGVLYIRDLETLQVAKRLLSRHGTRLRKKQGDGGGRD